MVPRETGNNAYAKFWRDKQRVLWTVFLILANIQLKTALRNLLTYPDLVKKQNMTPECMYMVY